MHSGGKDALKDDMEDGKGAGRLSCVFKSSNSDGGLPSLSLTSAIEDGLGHSTPVEHARRTGEFT